MNVLRAYLFPAMILRLLLSSSLMSEAVTLLGLGSW